MRRLGIVTVSRSDFGIYRPLLQQARDRAGIEPELYVSGMHLAPEFGTTIREVEGVGIPIAECVEMLLSSDTPESIATSLGLGVIGFASALRRRRPDLLLVLGDRFEMYAAAVAALPLRIPVAHIHGGELTAGAIDDAVRHSITKLAHLHFVALPEYGNRVVQLGEEPWRVTVCGALSLDSLESMSLSGTPEIEGLLGLPLDPSPLLVTFHPATLEATDPAAQLEAVLEALVDAGLPVVLTAPNADAGGRAMLQRLRRFADTTSRAWLLESAGSRAYFTLMSRSAAMVGNSSSGIIEAASFALPVVNIGSRQDGRVRPPNVIDVECSRAAIGEAIQRATDPGFRRALAGMTNPYRRGNAAELILSRLESCALDVRLVRKRFHDLELPPLNCTAASR